jgi:SAM-dependent methyltransferase
MRVRSRHEEYRQILALRNSALPEFHAQQKQAAVSLGRLLRQVKARVVWDIGVGSGEIVAALAASNPGIRFLGFDESPAMLAVARRRVCKNKNVSLHVGEVPKYRPPGGRADLAFCVGHTAPHFGAHALCGWLSKLGSLRPSTLCVDFISNWDELLSRPASVDWRRYVSVREAAQVGFIGTIVDGSQVWRTLAAGRITPGRSRFPSGRVHAVAVRQIAEPTSRYLVVLRTAGYKYSHTFSYEAGWGRMQAMVFTTTTDRPLAQAGQTSSQSKHHVFRKCGE